MLQKGGGREGEQGPWRMKHSSYGDGVAAKGATLEASLSRVAVNKVRLVTYEIWVWVE